MVDSRSAMFYIHHMNQVNCHYDCVMMTGDSTMNTVLSINFDIIIRPISKVQGGLLVKKAEYF